jgi:hypothetical protein
MPIRRLSNSPTFQTRLNTVKHIKTRLNTFKHVSNTFKHVQVSTFKVVQWSSINSFFLFFKLILR